MGLGQPLNFSHTKLPGGKPARVLFQDRKGYLWIGSNGLIRYDGAGFKVYQHEARDSSSITSDDVVSIAQDRLGQIWAGTMQGISRLDPETDSIRNYAVGAKGLNDAYNTVFVDANGTLWTGNYSGLSRYDPRLDRFRQYTFHGSAVDPNDRFVIRILQDDRRPSWVWVARHHSLLHLNTSTGETVAFPTGKDVFITNLSMDSRGRLWVCSWGQGLGQLDETTGQYRFHPFEPANSLGTSNVAIDLKEQQDARGHSIYYLVTAPGLTTLIMDSAYNWTGQYSRPFQAFNPADPRPPGSDIHHILIDRQNILWLATSQDLSHLAPNNRVFSTTVRPGLGTIYALKKRRAGGWWLGGWYGPGIMKVSSDLTGFETMPYLGQSLPADSRQVSALLEDESRQTLWAATFGGLYSIDLRTGSRTEWTAVKGDAPGLPSSHVISLARAGDRLWIGTYSRGLGLMDLATGRYLPLPFGLEKATGGGRINILYTDRQGRVWGGNGWSAFRIDPDGTWKAYSNERSSIRSKAEGDVTAFAEDSTGRLWVGSQVGLNRYCPETDDFDLYTTADGLSSDKIESLLTDRQGRFWIGTENGLTCRTPDGRFRRYYTQNGLHANGGFNSLTLDSKGEVLIGGTDFITRFNPDLLLPNTQPPPVYITAINLINHPEKKIHPDRVRAEGLELAYDENYLTLDFIALNLINPEQNEYKYRLLPLDHDWVQAGPERRATYTNLAPGRYTFQVTAANSDGVWTASGPGMEIRIRPAYWQTWWFKGFCLLAIAGVLYALYRYRLRQVLALERIRADISAGLHDEIGSTLSSISILSGMAATRPEAVAGTLGAINQSSRGLMEQMNDIVWSINPRYDSLSSLFQRIRQFADNALEAQDIDFALTFPDPLPSGRLAVQTRQNLYLILKEAINNIAKHSRARTVTMQVALAGQYVQIDLQDDGQGYDTNLTTSGNGLHNMVQRAGAIKAELTLVSSPGQGSHLRLRLRWNRYAIDPKASLA